MSYQIVLSDGVTVLTTIADNTVDNTTSLTLLGRNYPAYGQMVADNFVHLLESAASPASSPPSHPLVGQLWFNTTTNLLNVWTGNATWFPFTAGVSSVLGVNGQVTISQLTGGAATTGFLAPLNSPSFAGVPTTAATPALNDNSLKLATTAFVQNALSGISSGGGGGTVVGGVSSVCNLTGDITFAQLVGAGLAPLGGAQFTSTPSMTLGSVPSLNDSSTNIPTTSWVISKIGASSSGVSSVLGASGAVKLSDLTNPPSGGGVAPIDSPTFTTIASAPTAANGTNTTQLATTAFVGAAQTALLSGNNTWSGTNTYSGGPVLRNNIALSALDSNGVSQVALVYDTANYLTLGGGNGFRVNNGPTNMLLDNKGNLWTAGGIVAKGTAPYTGTTGSGQFVARSASYDLMLINDDTSSWLGLSNRNNPGAGYNGLRPLVISNSTGYVTIDSTGAGTKFGGSVAIGGSVSTSGSVTTGGNVNAGGNVIVTGSVIASGTMAGNGVITANNGRFRAAYGFRANSTDGNTAVLGLDYSLTGSYQIFPNGFIIQYGSSSTNNGGGTTRFGVAFPNAVASITVTRIDNGVGAWMSVWNQSLGAFDTYSHSPIAGGSWDAVSTSFFWMAIGW